jgi:MFS family permease
LVERYGAKRPLVIGPIIAAGGFTLFAVPSIGGGYWTTFFPAITLLGLGMSVTVAPLTTTVMNAVRPEQSGIASGVNNAVSRVASVLAIALVGIAMMSTFGRSLEGRVATMDLPPEAVRALADQRIRLAAAEIPHDMDLTKRAEVKRVIDESFVEGFRVVMFLATGLALASAACAWLFVGGTTDKHTD